MSPPIEEASANLAHHAWTVLPVLVALLAAALALNLLAGRALTLVARKTNLPRRNLDPFRKTVRAVIAVGGVALLLEVLGFNLSGLWTAVTTVFAMIAVGFIAVWSVLSNWLCTIVILITRPFAIGDTVEFAGEPVRGRVIDLNFVYTTLLCDDDCTLQIPNNLFFQKVIKRSQGKSPIPLAAQLNSRTPAA